MNFNEEEEEEVGGKKNADTRQPSVIKYTFGTIETFSITWTALLERERRAEDLAGSKCSLCGVENSLHHLNNVTVIRDRIGANVTENEAWSHRSDSHRDSETRADIHYFSL